MVETSHYELASASWAYVQMNRSERERRLSNLVSSLELELELHHDNNDNNSARIKTEITGDRRFLGPGSRLSASGSDDQTIGSRLRDEICSLEDMPLFPANQLARIRPVMSS